MTGSPSAGRPPLVAPPSLTSSGGGADSGSLAASPLSASPLSASPGALPLRLLRRWRERRGGAELTVLFTIAAIGLLLAGERPLSPPPSALLLRPPSLAADTAATALHAGGALVLTLLLSVALAALAQRSARSRRVLRPVLTVARATPALGLTGLLLLCLPCWAAVVTVTAFNTTARVSLGILDALETAPRELEEVSTGLNLTSWQHFWRVAMPQAIPFAAFRGAQAMPGLWFRLICAEALVSGLAGGTGGLGTRALSGLLTHRSALLLQAAPAAFVLILLADQLLTRPLVAGSRGYAVNGSAELPAPPSSWMTRFRRGARLGAVIGLAVRHALSPIGNWRFGAARLWVPLPPEGESPSPAPWWIGPPAALLLLAAALAWSGAARELPDDLLEGVLTLTYVCLALFLCAAAWLPPGVFFADRGRRAASGARLAVSVCALFPAVFLFPLFRASALAVPFLLFLCGNWSVGAAVLDGGGTIPASLRAVASGLGLRGGLLRRRLILPALAPHFCGGIMLATVPVWNAVVIAEAFPAFGTGPAGGPLGGPLSGLGATLLRQMGGGAPKGQIVAVTVLTLSSILLDRLVLEPLSVHAAQKYSL